MWERVSQQRPFGWSELGVFLFEGQCDSMAKGQQGGDGKEHGMAQPCRLWEGDWVLIKLIKE